ncbi:hypothetical protein [Algoriphagus sp. AK58]|uniref:hypothetical protein n=1 Tax=Algoriphagus sp. AK58 TaxID=1406877 RepID=UPI00164FE3B3|nr:hypothetical protein [Algoriphagus sp. AK58]MBC6367477.1 hypothetical protein [Algoriphagus sp. AK58]
MRILVIAEDLRVSGTSEGQVSRSFIYNLNRHPEVSSVDLLYFKCNDENHELEKLNIQNIWIYLTPKVGGIILSFLEKVCHKAFGKSLIDNFKIEWMKKKLRSIDFSLFDRIFVRSTGQSFLTIRACSILKGFEKKTVLYFHDPYPFFWDPGYHGKLTKIGINAFLEMRALIHRGFICTTPSNNLSRDLSFLYGTNKPFLTIPHQFVPEVFNFPEKVFLDDVEDKIVIMYHGAIQLGRTIEPFLEAFRLLIEEKKLFKDKVLLILRIKDGAKFSFRKKYEHISNIRFLEQVSAGYAYKEVSQYSHVNLILEPSGYYSNILVGKAPLLASLNHHIFVLGPDDSELKNLLVNKNLFANSSSVDDIKTKLKLVLEEILINDKVYLDPFNEYFSLSNFFSSLDKVLSK